MQTAPTAHSSDTENSLKCSGRAGESSELCSGRKKKSADFRSVSLKFGQKVAGKRKERVEVQVQEHLQRKKECVCVKDWETEKVLERIRL